MSGNGAEPSVVGRQGWRDLVFLHWELQPEAVRPAVPPPFELDLREGRAWVSIVAFEVRDLRPVKWRPWIALPRFLETNLRTYVRWNDEPAICFLTLDAASRLAVVGARLAYGLPYRHASMLFARQGEALEYGHVRAVDGASFHVRCRVGVPIGVAAPGSLEHFLVERYRFYVMRRGRVLSTEVRHPPYPLHAATVDDVTESLFVPSGLPPAAGKPLAHYSPGVDVELLTTKPADRLESRSRPRAGPGATR
jgi:uncharacterized protein YqjF (DUF2071 family)